METPPGKAGSPLNTLLSRGGVLPGPVRIKGPALAGLTVGGEESNLADLATGYERTVPRRSPPPPVLPSYNAPCEVAGGFC